MKPRSLCLIIVLAAAACTQLDLEGDLDAGGTRESWLASLDDTTPLSNVSLPGAHDAATSTVKAWPQWTRTQDLNVAQLWNGGVRAFDLRPAYVDGVMGIYHGKYSTGVTFPDVLSLLLKALERHPSEFAVLLVRHEVEADGGNPEWRRAMHDILCSYGDRLAAYRAGITVGELRGKLLVLSRSRYEAGPFGGFISGWYSGTELSPQQSARIEGGSGASFPLWVQDYYDPAGAEEKWTAVRDMLEATASADARPLVINHVSGYAGKLPDYRKNACVINARAAAFLKRSHAPAGIVMMDFAGVNTSRGVAVHGEDLVQAVIDNNGSAPS